MTPHEERRRKRKELHRKLNTIALTTVLGVIVAAAGYYTFTAVMSSAGRDRGASESSRSPSEGSSGGRAQGWGVGVGGALRAPVRAARLAASAAVSYWKRWRSELDVRGLGQSGGLAPWTWGK